ncbi:MAG: ATP-binding cassette domain-containing protein, partial [Acidobacteriaceae bacterium]|nr:ATP-binding cassette domain-containing protein [Acidobacteriaceae bacterium]
PEAPPLYQEMDTDAYLGFVGKLKGLAGADLRKRIDYVCERCAISDVKRKLLGKLSKGYRQRVGLAQAIIHNPDVLILDEPTAGLDPKQINETRDLIKSLAGDHTVILSTHILPEVEAICRKVIIINRGRLVATDSVERLKHRGVANAVQVQVDTDGQADGQAVRQRLEQVPGVSKVLEKIASGNRLYYEVESLPDRNPRADIARAIVHAGWNLLEMKSTTLSLEEAYLQLTGAQPGSAALVDGGVQ